MGFFKTKEEKLILLKKELEDLKEKYKKFSNSLMMIGDYVFVFRGFEIKDNEIKFCYEDRDTPSGHYNLISLSSWKLRYEEDFTKSRKTWIYFRDTLEKLGIEVIFKK